MTCNQCTEQLKLLFGSKALPDDLQAHIDQCDDCTALWAEQQALADGLDDDALFAVDAVEVDALVASVNETIDHIEQPGATNIISVPSMRKLRAAIIAAAAVVALVAGGLVVEEFAYYVDPVASVGTSQQIDVIEQEDGTDATEAALGDTTVSALLYEYAQAKPYSASEELLTEISDDEWQYLESEFDLGGLL